MLWAEILPFKSLRRFWAEVALDNDLDVENTDIKGVTSRQVILNLHILLCRHAEQSSDTITVGIPIRETAVRHASRRRRLLIRHDVRSKGGKWGLVVLLSVLRLVGCGQNLDANWGRTSACSPATAQEEEVYGRGGASGWVSKRDGCGNVLLACATLQGSSWSQNVIVSAFSRAGLTKNLLSPWNFSTSLLMHPWFKHVIPSAGTWVPWYLTVYKSLIAPFVKKGRRGFHWRYLKVHQSTFFYVIHIALINCLQVWRLCYRVKRTNPDMSLAVAILNPSEGNQVLARWRKPIPRFWHKSKDYKGAFLLFVILHHHWIRRWEWRMLWSS